MRNVPNVTCARKHQYTLPLLLPFGECAALFVCLVRASDKRDVLHALGGAISSFIHHQLKTEASSWSRPDTGSEGSNAVGERYPPSSSQSREKRPIRHQGFR